MAKRKRFTLEDYEEVKKILEENKIDSKRLACYGVFKKLRYLRHQKKIIATDEELEAVVNYEKDRKTLKHGENYEEGDLELPWDK